METANSPAVGTSSQAKLAQQNLGKNADTFTKSTYRFFDSLAHHSRGLVFVLGGVLVLLLASALLMGQKEKTAAEARSDLFLAEKKYETELKALAPPAPKPEGKDAKDAKAPPPDDSEYKAFDVNAKMPETIKAYRQVIELYPSTRAAYDARMALGHLYLQHGQANLAEEWLTQATSSSPRGIERALSFLALGYSREGQGKHKEAIDSFTTALSTGEDAAKGDALMGIARSYEALHDLTNARATYDKVIAQLPNTEYARNAELYKAQAQ
jgi:TolA-binding protein